MYHDIKIGNSQYDRNGVEDIPYILSESEFEKQIRLLYKQNYRTISLDDFVFHVKAKIPFPAKSIIITFDDGHISNYLKAYSILNKYGFKAIFFIIAGFIGRKDILTWEQIKEMNNNGMEIGSHTLTHPIPTKLNNQQLKFELQESKKILERNLGQEIKWLSSPTGYYNPSIESISKEVGYKAVCCGKFGGNRINANLFSLKRIVIKSSYDLSTFRSLVELRSVTVFRYMVTIILRANFRKVFGIKVYESIRKKLLAL